MLVKISKNQGFTLVELSLVMIVIGLLIGGILKGQELIENARITTLISRTKQVRAAYNTFTDIYHAKPGDFGSAQTMIPNCNDATFCRNGNGNTMLGTRTTTPWSNINSTLYSENTQFWKHLALADLLGGINPASDQMEWGDTLLSSPIAGGFLASTTLGSGQYASMQGLIIQTRARSDGQWLCGVATGLSADCSISPSQAYRIDNKIDDGHAQTGRVAAISMSYRTGCGTPNSGQNGANGYNMTSTLRSCDMFFKIGP